MLPKPLLISYNEVSNISSIEGHSANLELEWSYRHLRCYIFTFYFPVEKWSSYEKRTETHFFWCGWILLSIALYIQRNNPLTRSFPPWCRVFREQLTVAQQAKHFMFYGTWMFITVFTKAQHWALFRVTLIQATFSHATSLFLFNIILPSTHVSQVVS
jgi:hypothetical protein